MVVLGQLSEGVYAHISKLVGFVVKEVISLITLTACLYGLFLPQSDLWISQMAE